MPKEKNSEEEIVEEVTEKVEETATAETDVLENTESAAETAAEPEAVEEPTVAPADEPAAENKDSQEPQEPYSERTVTVQPVRFASFEEVTRTPGEANKNLDILMDIKLQLTVELGRTELPIKKVLELTRGSIIELEKVAGEPVELYANGKLVAHGEVVVIEDNFGLRVTSITDPEERLKGV